MDLAKILWGDPGSMNLGVPRKKNEKNQVLKLKFFHHFFVNICFQYFFSEFLGQFLFA
jgi:apolipoprotein N-acyltransferase